MIPSGQSVFVDESRFGALDVGLRVLSVGMSARFSGCGDFDARPPYALGYDAERPRAPQPVYFIPGRVVPLEF